MRDGAHGSHCELRAVVYRYFSACCKIAVNCFVASARGITLSVRTTIGRAKKRAR
jgi:hypothetical protein